jgi:DNA-binding beta-propeller fold protein YncE
MIRLIITVILLAISLIVSGCAGKGPRVAAESASISGIQVIKVIGQDIGTERSLVSPRDIAVNQMNEMFIADYGNDRIVKLDPNYAVIGEFGGYGAGGRSLSGPLSIALDNVSNIYVIDSGNGRVVRADRRLNFISAESGFTKDQLVQWDRPVSIKLTRRGDIFIGDYGLGACYKLDLFFTYVFDFGAVNSSVAIGYPSGIEIDKDDRVYVADSQNGKVEMFDSFGMSIGNIGESILDKPAAVAVSSDGGIWVADSGNKTLFCFDYRGREKFRWSGQGQYQLLQPAGLFITKDDIIYLVDSAAAKIYVLKPIPGK